MNRQLFFTLDVLSLACIAFMLASGLFYYGSLPEQMPIHFNAGGQADDYGPRAMIFLLPGIAIATSVLVGLIGRDPNNYNFPVKVTDENREALIGESRLLVSGIMFVTNLLLAYIHSADWIGASDGTKRYFYLVIHWSYPFADRQWLCPYEKAGLSLQ